MDLFEAQGANIGINQVEQNENTVIVDFNGEKAPVVNVGSAEETAILNCISMSLLDNLDDCQQVVRMVLFQYQLLLYVILFEPFAFLIPFQKHELHPMIYLIDPIPALVPLETKETFVKDFMGLSLKNIAITIYRIFFSFEIPVFSTIKARSVFGKSLSNAFLNCLFGISIIILQKKQGILL